MSADLIIVPFLSPPEAEVYIPKVSFYGNLLEDQKSEVSDQLSERWSAVKTKLGEDWIPSYQVRGNPERIAKIDKLISEIV
jgi:hypothetical protein